MLMFYYLIISTFALALLVSFIVMRLFPAPSMQFWRVSSTTQFMKHGQSTPNLQAWWSAHHQAFVFTIWKNTLPPLTYAENDKKIVIELTQERWVLEIYRTIIETLQGLAWMMLVFFMVALIAYVIVRWSEIKYAAKSK